MDDLYWLHVRNLSVSERISIGLMLLNRHAKCVGEKVAVSAKSGVFSAVLPSDKDLSDKDKTALSVLGWNSDGGGEHEISLY